MLTVAIAPEDAGNDGAGRERDRRRLRRPARAAPAMRTRDAFFARCRAEAPIFYSDALGAWVLARYDDVRAVLEDHRYLTLTDGPGSPIYGRSMLQWEGVEHNKKSGPVVKRIRSPRAMQGVDRRQGARDRPPHCRRLAARGAGRPAGRLRDAGAAARDHRAARHPRGGEVPEHVRRDHEGRHLEHRRPVAARGRLRGPRQPPRDRRSVSSRSGGCIRAAT